MKSDLTAECRGVAWKNWMLVGWERTEFRIHTDGKEETIPDSTPDELMSLICWGVNKGVAKPPKSHTAVLISIRKNTRHVMFLLSFVGKKQFPETQSVTLKSRWGFAGSNQKSEPKPLTTEDEAAIFFSSFNPDRSLLLKVCFFFFLFVLFVLFASRWMPYLPFSTSCPSVEVVARTGKRTDGGKEALGAKMRSNQTRLNLFAGDS